MHAEFYNLALAEPSTSVAAADARTTVSRSLTFVVKITFAPSFHISVMRVSPGYTTPANLTLMSLYGPNFCRTCFPEMPIEHRPCRIGLLKPPMAANSGRMCRGLLSPLSRYSAACEELVCSSTTASGARLGTAFAAVAGPRSRILFVRLGRERAISKGGANRFRCAGPRIRRTPV